MRLKKEILEGLYLEVLHGLQLTRGRGDERVDGELSPASEELLARCVADGARPVADDVVGVPRVRVHALCALLQSLEDPKTAKALDPYGCS